MSDYHTRPTTRDPRDAQATNLRSRSSSRDMSWRKPVPKFIPSPPISPNQTQMPRYTASPTATTFGCAVGRENQFSMSLASLSNDLPPLPSDWKENIDRVVKNDSSVNLRSSRSPPITPIITSPTYGFARGHHREPGGHHHTTPNSRPQTIFPDARIEGMSQVRIAEADKDQSVFREVDLGEMKSRDRDHSADKENVPPSSFNHGLKRLATYPNTNESNTSISRTTKVYRPPTPPLPSRKKTSAPPTPVTTTMTKPMHIVYPDLTGLGAESRGQRTRTPDDDTIDTRTLRTVHSSLTMWTNNRGASTDTSTLDDDDDRTLPVYQPHSVRKSMIESKSMLVVEPHRSGSAAGSTGAHSWIDSFLNPFKSCLSGQ